MTDFFAVGLFGLMGIFSRFGLESLFSKPLGTFPLSTLSINLVGSFIAGAVYVVGTEKSDIPPSLQIGLLVGFCGGFTTFSAYSLQSLLLIERGNLWPGLGYLLLSPILGLLAALAGISLARVAL